MGSSLSPGTNCTPEKWQKILQYNFLLLLPTSMVCGNQSWPSKVSQYYVACLPCNSSCSSAERPEWVRFKLHLDLQLPPRAELTFPNGQSTRGAEFAGERWSLRSAEAGARCRGRANVSKGRTLGTKPDSVCLVTDPTGFLFPESRNLQSTRRWRPSLKAGGSASALSKETHRFLETQTRNPVKKGKTFR